MKDLLKLGCSGLALAFAVGVAAEAPKAHAQGSSQPVPGRAAKTLFDDPDPTLALTPGNTRPRPAPPGSKAPNPDPKNFEGVWWLQGYQYLLGPEVGVPAPLKPQYIELLKKRIREKNAGRPETDTSTACFPHGMPRLMESPYPIEIVQTPGRVTFLHEVAHEVRRIYLDQKHPANLKESFLGHSVGHWDGDTLVVDTVGINDKSFIDDEGEAHSNKEHLTERYRKINGGRQIELTM
ncbi:MAG: hypothetical protein ACXU82_12285, partial [Caulobacteraceae bacterium]